VPQGQKPDGGWPVVVFNHDISANFATAMARSIRFFDTHLKGKDTNQGVVQK
jgi:hypothetical protein